MDLINDIIDGTDLQKRLINWKIKHRIYSKNDGDIGKVGLNYWRNFMIRNGHKIRSKNGKKYAVDRSNFTSYLNFKDMYDQIEEVLIEIKLTIPFVER